LFTPSTGFEDRGQHQPYKHLHYLVYGRKLNLLFTHKFLCFLIARLRSDF
jgi:hypothetical protein